MTQEHESLLQAHALVMLVVEEVLGDGEESREGSEQQNCHEEGWPPDLAVRPQEQSGTGWGGTDGGLQGSEDSV